MSLFSWLDYSEDDRRKMQEVIDLFRQRDTRDELGIGAIRDGFADSLFPGTSTIQTRARYFLFIPWMYRQLEERNVPSVKVADRARASEVTLIDALMDSPETHGVIGKDARRNLQRLPSAIYWNGLGAWGIRRVPLAQGTYHRSFDAFNDSRTRQRTRREGGELAERESTFWDANLPPAPPEFPRIASFALRSEDAAYLRDRVLVSHRESLLAFLLLCEQQVANVPFPWALPREIALPPTVLNVLHHARNFSESIHGAALLYNLMLAERASWEELTTHYRERLATWASLMEVRDQVFLGWSREAFWQSALLANARIAFPTRRFVDAWLDFALAPGAAHRIHEHAAARSLIEERESYLKGPLARLKNPEALALWRGESGAAQLVYRWPQASQIITDILHGLRQEVPHA